ncbi:MAG: hypothetical protein R3E34_03680 [Rhodocyclaceae bacterium]
MTIPKEHRTTHHEGSRVRRTERAATLETYDPNLVTFFAWKGGALKDADYRVYDAIRACCREYDIRDSGASPSKDSCLFWLGRNAPSKSRRIYIVISDSEEDANVIADHIDVEAHVYLLVATFIERGHAETPEIDSVDMVHPHLRIIRLRLDTRLSSLLPIWVSLILHAEFSGVSTAIKDFDRLCHLASSGAQCLISQELSIAAHASPARNIEVNEILKNVAANHAAKPTHVIGFHRLITDPTDEVGALNIVAPYLARSGLLADSLRLVGVAPVRKFEIAVFVLVI